MAGAVAGAVAVAVAVALTAASTAALTAAPTATPTAALTAAPTATPTAALTAAPTAALTAAPTAALTAALTVAPAGSIVFRARHKVESLKLGRYQRSQKCGQQRHQDAVQGRREGGLQPQCSAFGACVRPQQELLRQRRWRWCCRFQRAERCLRHAVQTFVRRALWIQWKG